MRDKRGFVIFVVGCFAVVVPIILIGYSLTLVGVVLFGVYSCVDGVLIGINRRYYQRVRWAIAVKSCLVFVNNALVALLIAITDTMQEWHWGLLCGSIIWAQIMLVGVCHRSLGKGVGDTTDINVGADDNISYKYVGSKLRNIAISCYCILLVVPMMLIVQRLDYAWIMAIVVYWIIDIGLVCYNNKAYYSVDTVRIIKIMFVMSEWLLILMQIAFVDVFVMWYAYIPVIGFALYNMIFAMALWVVKRKNNIISQ